MQSRGGFLELLMQLADEEVLALDFFGQALQFVAGGGCGRLIFRQNSAILCVLLKNNKVRGKTSEITSF